MFAIFSLRRPDILPVGTLRRSLVYLLMMIVDLGDLGVQRGLVRWILSLHSHKHSVSISPKKLPKSNADNDQAETQQSTDLQEVLTLPPRAITPDASTFPPEPLPVTPKKKRNPNEDDLSPDDEIPLPPPVFTPSINRTLNKIMPARYAPPPLPEGLSVAELQRRIEGKKIK